MIKPMLFDVIELIQPFPEENLPAGSQGTIVHQHNDHAFLVEFSNDQGETTALVTLFREQFIVVWQAEFQQALPLAGQLAELIEILPPQAAIEVLDFARFLATRQTNGLASALSPQPTAQEKLAA
jgi:hypothetical protein